MSVIEANAAQRGCVTIVYATPIGGKREFRFNHAYEAAKHVDQNRPDLFIGIPVDEDKRDEFYAAQRNRGYRLPE